MNATDPSGLLVYTTGNLGSENVWSDSGQLIGRLVTVGHYLFVRRYVNGEARYLPLEYVSARESSDFETGWIKGGNQVNANIRAAFVGAQSWPQERFNML